MIIDAGYINNKGEYIEDLMYFSFDGLTEKEKKQILDEENEKEWERYLEHEQEYDSVA